MVLYSHDENANDLFKKYSDYYKNKKYYWTTKKKDKYGNVMHLKRDPSGSIERVPHAFHGKNEQLTEPDVIEEGYNPNYYLKKEV